MLNPIAIELAELKTRVQQAEIKLDYYSRSLEYDRIQNWRRRSFQRLAYQRRPSPRCKSCSPPAALQRPCEPKHPGTLTSAPSNFVSRRSQVPRARQSCDCRGIEQNRLDRQLMRQRESGLAVGESARQEVEQVLEEMTVPGLRRSLGISVMRKRLESRSAVVGAVEASDQMLDELESGIRRRGFGAPRSDAQLSERERGHLEEIELARQNLEVLKEIAASQKQSAADMKQASNDMKQTSAAVRGAQAAAQVGNQVGD